ncbi:FAD:protein FMN transferase [Microbacterium jejuense]|uniref:FAD:protein FMN transferase n=1 Tax=Microbacterium jejuense TaxID=1263637 RepID=UPI0031F0EC2A
MSRPPRLVEVAEIMGTAISIHVVGDPDRTAFEAAVAACFDELRFVDRVFSPYRDDSDVLRIARGELAMTDASPWVAEVAEACARAEADTGGLFTAWWAGVFDPTGFVKGWSVERAAHRHLAPLLTERGVLAAGINAGGDLQLLTAPAADWVWNVAIVDPADRSRVLATLPVRDGAVATSGTAERGAHIVDPRSGTPATGVVSATVAVAGLAHADVWATAAVVAGPDDLSWISRAGRSTGLLVDDTGRIRRWLDGVEVQVRASIAG